MAVFPLSCAIYSKKASEITNKITNYGQILPLTNIHIFHEHQRNFINTGGWHAFPCVNPPTTELTITWNQSATPPYDISNTLVRSEIMGDLLKITFHPPQDLNELLYAPLTSRNILEFPSGPSDGLLVSKALKTKTQLCATCMNLQSVPGECHANPDRQFPAKTCLIHSVTFLAVYTNLHHTKDNKVENQSFPCAIEAAWNW